MPNKDSTKQPMPKMIKFVIVNSAIGILIGWLFAACLIYFNIANLGELMWNTDHKVTAIFILALSFGTTFGFGYLATAVLLLPYNKDDFDRV